MMEDELGTILPYARTIQENTDQGEGRNCKEKKKKKKKKGGGGEEGGSVVIAVVSLLLESLLVRC